MNSNTFLPIFSVYGNRKGVEQKRRLLEDSENLANFSGNEFKYVFTYFFGLWQQKGGRTKEAAVGKFRKLSEFFGQ